MEIDDLLIRKLAKLSRIELIEEDFEKIKSKLQVIVNAFSELSLVDTKNVDALFTFQDSLRLREDLPKEPLPVDEVLKNSPESLDGNFKIQRMHGGEE